MRKLGKTTACENIGQCLSPILASNTEYKYCICIGSVVCPIYVHRFFIVVIRLFFSLKKENLGTQGGRQLNILFGCIAWKTMQFNAMEMDAMKGKNMVAKRTFHHVFMPGNSNWSQYQQHHQMKKKMQEAWSKSFKIYDEVAMQVHLVEHWGWSTSPLYSSMEHFFVFFCVLVAAAVELYDYTISSVCCAKTCTKCAILHAFSSNFPCIVFVFGVFFVWHAIFRFVSFWQ